MYDFHVVVSWVLMDALFLMDFQELIYQKDRWQCLRDTEICFLDQNKMRIWGGLTKLSVSIVDTPLPYTFSTFNSLTLTDLEGVPGACPPKGPDSFVLTYKMFET